MKSYHEKLNDPNSMLKENIDMLHLYEPIYIQLDDYSPYTYSLLETFEKMAIEK